MPPFEPGAAKPADSEFWRKSLLRTNSTFQDAITNLNKFGIKIVLVVNDNGQLEGTISDGDIRRNLLRGVRLDASVNDIVHTNALVVPPDLSRSMVVELMEANNIQQIPVVDARRNVVGLHLWNQISVQTKRQNIFVIMAGGKGTRLAPHTETCPKPMLPVAGKPMMEHIVLRARAEGFSNFVFAIHHLGDMVENYFGDGSKLDVDIRYLREEAPLGTAGALQLFESMPSEPFVVTNGDVLTDIQYGELLEFHVRHKASATMAVRQHEWQNPFGVVHTRGIEITKIEEKPLVRSHINAGVYVLDPKAILLLNPGEQCDMPTIFEQMKAKSELTLA